MKFKGLLMLLMSISLMGSGCSTLRFAPRAPDVYNDASYTPVEYNTDLLAYKAAATAASVRTYYRNKIVFSTAKEIDKNYAAFKNLFFRGRAGTETLLDMVQIGLGSAGTLAGGQSTKAILAAIATGVTGSRLSFNKNFFKEKTPEILIARMDALRADKWSQIYLKLMKPDTDYSLYEAEYDLVAYYHTGSLQAAFQNIIAESGATQKKAENEIWKQIERKYGGSIGGELASEEERREVKQMFEELEGMKNKTEREQQAQKVVESFKKLRPERHPDPKASNFEQVVYFYSLVIRGENRELRTALTQAFKEAKSK